MSPTARAWLMAFDALAVDVQREVTTELLRRALAAGGLSDTALEALAADLFVAYDAEEARRAGGPCAGGP